MPSPSLWRATAGASPPTATLTESQRVDVAVIGAGYAGITAALALAEGGARVTVLEAGDIGEGGSGLNGGQVIPGLKLSPSELLARFGPERGTAVIRFTMATADRVFELVQRHGIDCDAQRNGWIQAAVSPATLPVMERRVAEAMEWGGDAILLDAAAMRRTIGSNPGAYCGGWLDRRAGTVHPLNYLQGLVRAAQHAGATVCTRSRALSISADAGRWRVATAGPALTADAVLLFANAYADGLWPGLRTSILAANSLQVCTAPLSEAQLAAILPARQAVSDGRRVMNYYRIGPGGRFMIGGRGPFGAVAPRHYAELRRDTTRLFPALRDAPIEHAWEGRVALTRDYLPHVHQPRAGLWLALGCNGRGVGLMSALGIALGRQLLGGGAAQPFEISPVRPLPLHRLHRLYAGALIRWFRLLDRVA
jgi:glycine/D-amino acid oxidase-like deaminating enzyme